jgi:hypothetical protein
MDAGPTPGTDPGARRLAGIIDEEHALCLELDGLSVAQSAMVEGGDTEGVLEVLGRRQRIIDRIVTLNAELAPLRERRDELMAALPAQERERVRSKVGEIAQTVERVRARDEQDRLAMERRRAGIAGELSGLARARGAVAAYAAPRGHDGGGARFQDREG